MSKLHRKKIAVLCNDIHLSHSPPVGRDVDRAGWYAAMADALGQVADLAGGLPVICAGDLFDRWNAPAELITFAMRHLPQPFYCIPGQHDLPHHVYDDRGRSAYGCLVEAGAVRDLEPGEPHRLDGINLHAFPWGCPVTPCTFHQPNVANLAVVHEYIYAGKSTAYPGAPKSGRINGWAKKLEGYNIAHFGDNHKHFTKQIGDTTVWNGGGFMVRKRDEHRAGMVPRIAALYACSQEGANTYYDLVECGLDDDGVWHADDTTGPGTEWDMSEFIDGMRSLGESCVDFRDTLLRAIEANRPCRKARKMILSILDEQ